MRENRGFTLLEIMIVVGILAVVSAIAVPNMLNAREKSHASVCFSNRQALTRAEQLFVAQKGRPSLSIEELQNGEAYMGARCTKGGVYFWLDVDQGTETDLIHTIIGCSVHGIVTTEEENEALYNDLLFSEAFDGDLSKWSEVRGKWAVKDGTLVSSGNRSMIITNSGDYKNAVVNVDVTFDNSKSSASILFRSSADKNKLTSYSLELDQNSKKYVFAEYTDGKRKVIDQIKVPKDFDWTGTHNMQIKTNNDSFTLYVDGKQALSSSDTSLTSGSIGLMSTKDVRFDNLTVKEQK